MTLLDWSDEKNEWLRRERGITFEDAVYHLTHEGLLDIIEHPNQEHYPGQRPFIINVEGYACVVPFVEEDDVIFLKTIMPSRKMTKLYHWRCRNMKLTKEEKDILDSVERGEWKRIPMFKQEVVRYKATAQATLRKDKRVNIRMTERDLIHFQKTAVHEGLPYQTLISSILHKYINGRLVEKTG